MCVENNFGGFFNRSGWRIRGFLDGHTGQFWTTLYLNRMVKEDVEGPKGDIC